MSWEQLVNIVETARLEHDELQAQPPRACPRDGEPLREGPDGRLFCPSDGWRPEQDPDWR